jgi:hypothetical protein
MQCHRRSQREHGAVAVLVALMLAVLIGAAGIVLDLGRLFVVKTELQNAADACALAAVRELTGTPTTLEMLTRAENAGITVGNRHRSDFQDDPVQFATDQDVTFSSTLDGAYVTKNGAPTDVAYVRCTRNLAGFLPWFMQVLGAGSSSVGSTAVASMQGAATACGIPLGMCRKNTPPPCTVPGETPDIYGLCRSQWYNGRFEAGGSPTGNFNWLDYTPPAGGASELAEALARSGYCDIKTGVTTFHAETGMMQSVKDAWNSRFGLYKNGGQYEPATAVPDTTGYAYGPTNWPQGYGAYADFVDKRRINASYGYPSDTTAYGNQTTGLNVINAFRSSQSGSAGPHATGADRRVVTMPVVDCASWGPTHEVVVSGWACALMVTPLNGPNDEVVLEYLGPVGSPGVPCSTYGQSGGPTSVGPKVPSLVQ